VGARGEEDGGEFGEALPVHPVPNALPAADLDPLGLEPLDLAIQDGPREPVAWDSLAEHAAGLGVRLEHGDPVSETVEMVCARETCRTRAHQRDSLRPPWFEMVGKGLLEDQVAQIPLHPVDRHGFVETLAVAGLLARVVANPAGDGGHGVLAEE
jgi:hypothetical protein